MRPTSIFHLMVVVCSTLLTPVSFTEQATASSTARIGIDRLVAASGLILVGSVTDVQNIGPDVDSGLWPLTRYQLCDIEVIAGVRPESRDDGVCFDLDVPGGLMADGETGYSMGGMPRLELERRYLMFLTAEEVYNVPWVGWQQGLWEVRGDEDGGWLFDLAGRPLAFVLSSGELVSGETRATWLQDHPGADESEIPFEVLAEVPVSVTELREMIEGREIAPMPANWRANQDFNDED